MVFVYEAGGTVIAEYSTALAAVQQVSYMTTDHLGSPRITTNENGAVTNRKDFTAYGDEVISAQRVSGTSGNGYQPSSPTREDYTGYEKDLESGLEFAQARYYSTTHGRFTSVDPLTASASIRDPQTFNRYSYVLNSPYKFTDPLGLLSVDTIACGQFCSNSGGGYVDGSAFRGTDTTFDWTKPRSAHALPPPAAAQQNTENPTNPKAPVPGTADFTTPDFGILDGNSSTQAAYDFLIGSFGATAEVTYSSWSPIERAVFLNTVAAVADAGGGILPELCLWDSIRGTKMTPGNLLGSSWKGSRMKALIGQILEPPCFTADDHPGLLNLRRWRQSLRTRILAGSHLTLICIAQSHNSGSTKEKSPLTRVEMALNLQPIPQTLREHCQNAGLIQVKTK